MQRKMLCPLLVLAAAAVLSSSSPSLLAAAQGLCQYPCIKQNGCVCNHTQVWDNEGENFGTCMECGLGWTGADCSNVSTQCYNGGVMMTTVTNTSLGCNCTSGWGGNQCGVQRCVNSINGSGPDHIAPVNATNQCGRCQPGYTGLSCDMCTTDAQCDNGKRCVTSPVATGSNKRLYCELTNQYWIDLMSYFRVGVKAYATMQCENLNTPNSTAIGSCFFSIWRLEPNGTWFDPFFYCSAQNCSAWMSEDTVPAVDKPVPESAEYIRAVFMGFIYAFLLFMIINGVVPPKRPHQRVSRFAVLSIWLVLVFIGFIIFCVFFGHETMDPEHTEVHAQYECLHSKCECAPDPPLGKDYDPHCIGSTMDQFFFPYMVDKMKVECDLNGVCSLAHENLGYAKIPLQCEASECTHSDTMPPIQDSSESEGVPPGLLSISSVGIVLGIALFAFYKLRQARRLAAEFRSMYDLECDDQSLHNSPTVQTEESLLIRAAKSEQHISVQLDLRKAGYHVSGRSILTDTSVTINSGELVAIMGASGAGKTTLLDILSKRDKRGVVSGELIVNGVWINRQNELVYKRMIGYVAQQDTLIPALTVRESIRFAARLKLPAAIPDDVIEELVEDVIQKLHLTRCSETPVGNDASRGVSGGEKRRVSIAMELVACPHILFLDEPTSGLDSVSAHEVMRCIVNLTRGTHIARFRRFFRFHPAVVFSIHQPSTEVFGMFDRLIVVSEGAIVYSGPAKEALSRISETVRMDGVPSAVNEAETILRIDHLASPAQRALLRCAVPEPKHFEAALAAYSVLEHTRENQRFYPNVVEQFLLLSRRTWCSLMGSYYLIMCHAFATLFLGIVLSLLYHKETLDLAGTEDKAGMVTFLLLVVGFSAISSLDLFISEKRLYMVERENGYYSSVPYYITKVVFDFVPLRIMPSAILASVIYFPMGLRDDEGAKFLWFVGIVVLFQMLVTGICLCVASLAPTFGAGALYSALIILWHTAFGGLMIQSTTIPKGFVWCKYLSPFYFAYEALMINELDGLGCLFDPANAEGNKESVKVPIPCAQFLFNMGLYPEHFTDDVTALALWVIGYLILGGILVHLLRLRV